MLLKFIYVFTFSSKYALRLSNFDFAFPFVMFLAIGYVILHTDAQPTKGDSFHYFTMYFK